MKNDFSVICPIHICALLLIQRIQSWLLSFQATQRRPYRWQLIDALICRRCPNPLFPKILSGFSILNQTSYQAGCSLCRKLFSGTVQTDDWIGFFGMQMMLASQTSDMIFPHRNQSYSSVRIRFSTSSINSGNVVDLAKFDVYVVAGFHKLCLLPS